MICRMGRCAGVVAVVTVGLALGLSAESVRCVNYDEAKVGPYVLEDPLVFVDGRRLESAADWPSRRREMLDILQREEFGRWPEKPDAFVFEKTEESAQYFGLGIRRQYSMWFREDRSGPRIDWMLLLPTHRRGPVPVIVMLNNKGNHELFADEGVRVHDAWVPRRQAKGTDPHRLDASRRGALRWPLETVLSRGYAVLMSCYSQAAPDPDAGEMTVADCRSRGCYALWKNAGDIGTLTVWGWALSRGLDLAERLPELDAGCSVAFGCSRLAKAALVAGAFDERFKVVVPCQSGCGGPALLKRQFGENVDWMNKEFQHWFCKKFLTYANNEQSMPFDQHFLLAAVAPRHLLIEGFDEPWYDTRGEWLACRAASPVWTFLAKPGLPDGEWPADYSTAAIGSHLGYVRRPGSHGISAYDWNWMLDFADRAFSVK